MSKPFMNTTTTTTKNIETVVKEATNDKRININTIYQRDVVWDEVKQANFINSCYLGIIPMPLLFNSVAEEEQISCIDGKQRITSLVNFKKNMFPVKINKKKYFYDKIPNEYKE